MTSHSPLLASTLALSTAFVLACSPGTGASSGTDGSTDTETTAAPGDTETTAAPGDTETTSVPPGDTETTVEPGDTETTVVTGEPDTDSTPSAIAFLRAEKPAPPFGEPPPGDPDDILIDITDFTRTCGEPYGFPECGPEAYRELTFVLNPDEQQPGSYAPADLDAELWSQSSVDSPCESNGPFAVEGTIEIVALTAEEITVRVEGSEHTDGEYTVVRCAG